MSATAVRSEYASLSTTTLPAVIRTEAENERYIAMLKISDRKGSRLSAAEKRMAQLLTLLVEDFEEKHYALKSSNPVNVLRELILANNLKQKDLWTFSEHPALFLKFFMESDLAHYGTHSAPQSTVPRVARSLFLIPSRGRLLPRRLDRQKLLCKAPRRNFPVTPANAPDHSTAKLTQHDDAF